MHKKITAYLLVAVLGTVIGGGLIMGYNKNLAASVDVVFLRNGQQQTVTVVLEEMPSQQ